MTRFTSQAKPKHQLAAPRLLQPAAKLLASELTDVKTAAFNVTSASRTSPAALRGQSVVTRRLQVRQVTTSLLTSPAAAFRLMLGENSSLLR